MRAGASLLIPMVLAGCIGESPESKLEAEQGDYEDGDEEHRPGQPCLVCHGEDHSPGGDIFVIAGTVFRRAADDDENGLDKAQVTITDSRGRSFTAETNTAGNFMVQVDAGVAVPVQRRRGRFLVNYEPDFPLTVSVSYRGIGETFEEEMESIIGLEGSCSTCHRDERPSTDKVEKVWVEEGPP